jgi:hypothetical protein
MANGPIGQNVQFIKGGETFAGTIIRDFGNGEYGVTYSLTPKDFNRKPDLRVKWNGRQLIADYQIPLGAEYQIQYNKATKNGQPLNPGMGSVAAGSLLYQQQFLKQLHK